MKLNVMTLVSLIASSLALIAGTTGLNYSDLCESTGGDLVTALCCDDQPFKVDTCKGEVECPMGGVTCANVVVCDCREDFCFSMEFGYQLI